MIDMKKNIFKNFLNVLKDLALFHTQIMFIAQFWCKNKK